MEFELQELDAAIAVSKTNKAPGPDRIQSELVKYLNGHNREILLQSYNEILVSNKYYESLYLANIASIFKKGDPSNSKITGPLLCCRPFTSYQLAC